jgi:cysteine-rich repeat protein
VIEQGWVCGNNSPSQCVLPPPGDVCQSAQPLISGNYSMSGFGDECVIYCAPDRWLTTTLASGDLLVVNTTTNSIYATARLYDLTNATCGTGQMITYNYFSYGGASQLVTQAQGGPATIAFELADLASEPSNASFTLDVRQGLPHCGDSYADTAGAYGVAEQCDDGNNFDNDGCSSTCFSE